eukprot:1206069-Pleurochrysis_carterae.AAC.1
MALARNASVPSLPKDVIAAGRASRLPADTAELLVQTLVARPDEIERQAADMQARLAEMTAE